MNKMNKMAVDRTKKLSELVGPISKIINKVLKTQNKDSKSITYSVSDACSSSSTSCENCYFYDLWKNEDLCGCCDNEIDPPCDTYDCMGC